MAIYPVDAPLYKFNKITMEPAGIFKSAVVKYDGTPIKWKHRKALLKDDNGQEREVTLSSNPFDPYPWVSIEGTKYYPMGKLGVVEQIFVYLPLCLLAIGGGIGGGLGAFASIANSSLMREFKDNAPAKFGLSLLTTLLATLSWYLLSMMIHTMVGR